MNVLEIIVEDHGAARELYAEAGNAAQQADLQRAGNVARLRALWSAHNAMMSDLVYPALAEVDAALVRRATERQDQTATLLEHLAAHGDAPAGIAGDWLAAFERFKTTLEHQCRLESTEVTAAIRDRLPPPAIARLTEAALALRREKGI